MCEITQQFFDEGYQVGFEKGYQIGFEKGVQIGRALECLELIQKLIKNTDYSIEQALEILDISKGKYLECKQLLQE